MFAALLEAVGAMGVLIGIVHNPKSAATLLVVGPLAVRLGYDVWLIWCSVGVMAFYALKNIFLIFHYYLQIKSPYHYMRAFPRRCFAGT